jgi:hypothetical protein
VWHGSLVEKFDPVAINHLSQVIQVEESFLSYSIETDFFKLENQKLA